MGIINSEVLKTLKSDTLQKINQGKKRVHIFNVDFKEYNEGFIGQFKMHYPTQLEKLQMGVTKATLLGGAPVDVMTNNIAHIISTLDIAIDEKPEWFDIENVDLEYEIMLAVFEEYDEWVNSFRRPVSTSTNKPDSTDVRGQVPVVGTEDLPRTTNGAEI